MNQLQDWKDQMIALWPLEPLPFQSFPFGSPFVAARLLSVEPFGIWVESPEAAKRLATNSEAVLPAIQSLLDNLRQHPDETRFFVPFSSLRLVALAKKTPDDPRDTAQ
jgi:hypothetical protein